MTPVTLASVAFGGESGELPSAIVARVLGPRPGPVHVDFDPSAPSGTLAPAPVGAARCDLDHVRELLGEAQRPVVVAGVGTRAHGRAVAGDVALALASSDAGPAFRSSPRTRRGESSATTPTSTPA